MSGLILLSSLSLAQNVSLEGAAAVLQPLIGTFEGNLSLVAFGERAAMRARVECEVVGGGSGVSCALTGRSPGPLYVEADLFGVDALTGDIHFYAISNAGDAHDHVGAFTASNVLDFTYAWTADGVSWAESIRFQFQADGSIVFHSLVTADGAEAIVLAGTLAAV